MFHRVPVVLYCFCIGLGFLGILGSLTPFFSAAEENLGLHMLYLLRGPEQAPADAVVVAIDRESAKALNLPATPHKWPRMLHARLLERLRAQQVAVVAFDLIFYEPQDAVNDQAFAAAMHKAGNVILSQTIDRRTMPFNDRSGSRVNHVNIEKTVSAIPLLADAALGEAPFPLPKVPHKLSQYWRFCPSAGDVPTLPVVALHVFASEVFDRFVSLLQKADPAGVAILPDGKDGKFSARQMVEMIRSLYGRFENNPDLAPGMLAALESNSPEQMSARTLGLVQALIGLYRPGCGRYLNFYGPPGTIETISYHKLLAAAAADHAGAQWPQLKGKAVFVGQTESDWFKANDGFYTAFTEKSGMDISGVEIAATAFANLLEDKAVHPLGPVAYFVILFGWGVLGGLIGSCFSTTASVTGILLLNSFYIGMAYVQFKIGGIWYPLVVPILLQTPVAFIGGLVWKYRKANTERRNIRDAFGYFLPDEVVNRLAVNLKNLRTGGQVLYSICLFTDAENYTTLSETMDPESLTQLMNTYYAAIFKPIKDNQGLVLQVIGDSVLAIWTAPQSKSTLKAAACKAAIGISESVQQFNATAGDYPLFTRIGIHAGEILLGNIGAMDHFEYRPVGDIVNTASRLEGLNKFLGTRMLASAEVLEPDNGYLTRPVGRFVFKGKSRPVSVHEIIPHNGLSRDFETGVCRIFASGLQAFESRFWDEAEKYFNQVLRLDENDGPSQFYLNLCRDFQQAPPDRGWDGAVHLKQK